MRCKPAEEYRCQEACVRVGKAYLASGELGGAAIDPHGRHVAGKHARARSHPGQIWGTLALQQTRQPVLAHRRWFNLIGACPRGLESLRKWGEKSCRFSNSTPWADADAADAVPINTPTALSCASSVDRQLQMPRPRYVYALVIWSLSEIQANLNASV